MTSYSARNKRFVRCYGRRENKNGASRGYAEFSYGMLHGCDLLDVLKIEAQQRPKARKKISLPELKFLNN